MIRTPAIPQWWPKQGDAVLTAALFPLLLVSVAFGQSRPVAWVVAIGQVASVAGTAVAVTIVARSLPSRLWPLAVIGGLFVARGARLLTGDPVWLVIAYTVIAAVLYSAAGALVVTRRPGLLRRQFVALCAISAPIMVLQIIGVEWTHVLRTDIEVNATRGLYPTLFVPVEQIVTTGVQSRPAGLMYANNVFSIIVLLGLGLHFGVADRRLPSAGDVAVLAVVVLLMAKITLLGIALVFVMRMFWGPDARMHTLGCLIVLLVLLGMYRLAFPGLFALSLAPVLWITNFQTRLADLLLATRIPALEAIAARFPAYILTKLQGSGATQSGYAQLAERGRSLLPTFVVALPYFYLAGRAFFRFDRATRREIVVLGAMVCVAPLISPYFSSLLFWFLAGGALRPLWAIVNSGLVPGPVATRGDWR